jgi:5'-nucleotidase
MNSCFVKTKTFAAKHQAILRQACVDGLMVITDFDATLTTGNSMQCHDLIYCSADIPDSFREECAPLLDWQTNPLTDSVLWWDQMHKLMVKHGMPQRTLIPRIVKEGAMTPRPGAIKLLKHLSFLNVPVLIVSAGLSDVIEEFLRQHDALNDNITICSNRLNYGTDLAPLSVSPVPYITSFTKRLAYAASSTFFNQNAKRRTLFVLGDSIADTDVTSDVSYDHLLTIGILNSRSRESEFQDSFDALVLGDDGSLSAVDALISDVVAAERSRPVARVDQEKKLRD